MKEAVTRYCPEFSDAIRDFQDFLRAQKGAYSDACSGYRRNERTIKRQTHRWIKPGAKKVDQDGRPTVIMESIEDPSQPDALVHNIRLVREYLAANERAGSNEQQLCRAQIIFIFTHWDDVTRYRCAKALGVEKNEIKLPIAGDLRLLRHAILHSRNILPPSAHAKLEALQNHFEPGAEIVFTHAKMHEIFRLLDKHIATLLIKSLEMPEPPGGVDEIKEIAIERRKR